MGPMLRWFLFTIGFGLLPFALAVVLRELGGGRVGAALTSPALLFFAVMVCAAQVSGLLVTLSAGEPIPRNRRDLLSAFFAVFLLGGVFSAMLYGVYVNHELNDPALRWNTACSRAGGKLDGCADWLTFRMNLFTFSMWVAAGPPYWVPGLSG
jgi:hypothetical protein